tara:strand:- start:7639 stop:8019 length:381 start_codon:yes stop_codon:yes gene_type:complete
MAIGKVLKTILSGAMQKYPIGTPVALGATAAAGLGVLGNEDSGLVGRNTKNSDDIDWIETTYDGKTYEFANTPHVHQIMIDNGPLHMKETVDELVEVGLMRLIEDDSSPYTKDLPSGNTIGVGDFR